MKYSLRLIILKVQFYLDMKLKLNSFNPSHIPMTVATTSKQSSGLFWKSLTKGNAINGRYSTSPKMAAQWAKADKTLRKWATRSDKTLQKSKKIQLLEWKCYRCSPRCSFGLLMGYFCWSLLYAGCTPLSVKLLYAAWFSGRRSSERHTNILPHGRRAHVIMLHFEIMYRTH